MSRPKFYLIEQFARRCSCATCELWKTTRGRSAQPCPKSVSNAAILQQLQEESGEVTAQPSDREIDPDADRPPPRFVDNFDEFREVDDFLLDQRREHEEARTNRRRQRA